MFPRPGSQKFLPAKLGNPPSSGKALQSLESSRRQSTEGQTALLWCFVCLLFASLSLVSATPAFRKLTSWLSKHVHPLRIRYGTTGTAAAFDALQKAADLLRAWTGDGMKDSANNHLEGQLTYRRALSRKLVRSHLPGCPRNT